MSRLEKLFCPSPSHSSKSTLCLNTLTEWIRESPYCIDSCNEFVIATGDEGGVVRLFDIRKKNPVDELLIDDGRCEDTINDIYIDSNGKYLVAASADGTLCAYNCKSTGSNRLLFHSNQTSKLLKSYFKSIFSNPRIAKNVSS